MCGVSWYRHFQTQLDEVIEQDRPSLQALARRQAVSTRTLQRRLAEHGTTWRAELEAARQLRAQRARQAGPIGMVHLASHLGYTDPRSVRRAQRRWDRRSGRVFALECGGDGGVTTVRSS
jgi:AraC-like DNA-binding protein